MGPLPVMLAGVMPTSDSPGVMMPGQFGPMMRVALPLDCAYAQASAVSPTGTPSVITTSRGISASMASIIAFLVKAGGTNAMDTSAPVFSIASATDAKTGSSTAEPSAARCSTVVPALRAFTPPTTCVPALSIRAVCLVPSPPVMPWTMTLESLLRKIVMFLQSLCVRELGGLVGAFVHGFGEGDERVVRVAEDRAPLLDLVAVEPHDERLGRGRAQLGERTHDALGDGVARRDAAEHVDEHALDLRVAEDDVQASGHDLGRGATADVEEVRRLDAAVVLARVGDDVEGRHHQACAVADDSDLAVELDVVEVVLLGLGLERVGGVLVLEQRVARVTELRVLVERHLAVEGDDLAILREDQRVDLDERRVLAGVDGVELDEHVRDL